MNNLIFAFGQYFAGKLHPASLEILTPLKDVAEKLNLKLILLCLVDEKERFLSLPELKIALADEIWYIAHENLSYLPEDLASEVLAEVVKRYQPFGFFFPATKTGLSLAPRLAGKLRLGLCAHVVSLVIEEGNLVLLRPTYGENIIAHLISRTRPIMATLALNAYPIKERPTPSSLKEIFISEDFNWQSKLKHLSYKPLKVEPNKLSLAKVIVAGGMGLKRKENFELLFDLAHYLSGEVGATRPVVHAGWTTPDRMIGVSGVSVKPKLYLAFGISGAIQHTVGMENSEFIIAVNTDPEAPLMKMAHIACKGDAESLLKALLTKLKSREKSS